jgi:hypothetical protein
MNKVDIQEVKKDKDKAKVDMIISQAKDMARVKKAIFEAYVAEGFTEAQALHLVKG